jgi:hypothetical protein
MESVAGLIPTIVVVVDALDEAQEAVQDHLIEKISALPFPDIRIFCMSRQLSKFSALFAGSCQIEIRATDSDLQTYVEGQIQGKKRLSALVGDGASLRDEIKRAIIEKSDGMCVRPLVRV